MIIGAADGDLGRHTAIGSNDYPIVTNGTIVLEKVGLRPAKNTPILRCDHIGHLRSAAYADTDFWPDETLSLVVLQTVTSPTICSLWLVLRRSTTASFKAPLSTSPCGLTSPSSVSGPSASSSPTSSSATQSPSTGPHPARKTGIRASTRA